jgi:hypothetical protein
LLDLVQQPDENFLVQRSLMLTVSHSRGKRFVAEFTHEKENGWQEELLRT